MLRLGGWPSLSDSYAGNILHGSDAITQHGSPCHSALSLQTVKFEIACGFYKECLKPLYSDM